MASSASTTTSHRWLPEFAGPVPPITARQLLDHTSGVRDNPCQADGTSLDQCVRTLASSPREFPAGTKFSYGNAPFLVVGRLIEVLGGADFAAVVRERLAGPLGMAGPTWPGAPSAPNPAFGAQVTVDDYGRMLDMLLHHGMAGGTRVLSPEAVARDRHQPGGEPRHIGRLLRRHHRRSPGTDSAAGPTWRTRPDIPRS